MKYVWLFLLMQCLLHGIEWRYDLHFVPLDTFKYWAGSFCLYLFVFGFAFLLEPKE